MKLPTSTRLCKYLGFVLMEAFTSGLLFPGLWVSASYLSLIQSLRYIHRFLIPSNFVANMGFFHLRDEAGRTLEITPSSFAGILKLTVTGELANAIQPSFEFTGPYDEPIYESPDGLALDFYLKCSVEGLDFYFNGQLIKRVVIAFAQEDLPNFYAISWDQWDTDPNDYVKLTRVAFYAGVAQYLYIYLCLG